MHIILRHIGLPTIVDKHILCEHTCAGVNFLVIYNVFAMAKPYTGIPTQTAMISCASFLDTGRPYIHSHTADIMHNPYTAHSPYNKHNTHPQHHRPVDRQTGIITRARTRATVSERTAHGRATGEHAIDRASSGSVFCSVGCFCLVSVVVLVQVLFPALGVQRVPERQRPG